MKYFLILIFVLFFNLPLLSHPILQKNVTIKIKEKSEYEIVTSINLAFLLCQDLISNFEKYDQEFKRLIALSNEDFLKEALSRKAEILAKFNFGFDEKRIEDSTLEIDISQRKPQLLLGGSIPDALSHSNELSCTLNISGKILSPATVNLYWENVDFVVIDMLKLNSTSGNEEAVIWVKPFERRVISLTNLPIKTIDAMKEYIKQGFLHILPRGLDHILFMLCLFFLFKNWKSLILQISVFTIAHSITLILVTLHWFSIKSSIVEPLIALSICVVGVENLFSDKINKYRLSLIFLFGLLHGMGFADALIKLGLPENKLLVSLVSFNVGVELGQIAVVSLAYLIVGHWFYQKEWYRHRIAFPCSIIIALYAFYLFVDRLAIF